ncbi:MAG TPA: kelch repeat-containing protein [Thermoplasmata archaeon]|nr:kelch repeat-containing protein [Thermoplasmata archaeon]
MFVAAGPRHRARGWAVPFALVALMCVGFPTALGAHAPARPQPGPAVPNHLGAISGRTSAPSAEVLGMQGFPNMEWGTAIIVYGPGDDTTHFLGEGARMVVDDHLRNVTVFGGEGSGGLSNQTIIYNYSSGDLFVDYLDPSPTARTNASFADVPGRDFAVLFGGLTDLRTQRASNETWVYYFGNETWRNVTRAVAPPPRESAAFAVNSSAGTGLLEGGWDPAYRVNGSSAVVLWNDTWSINLTTFRWTQLHPANAPAPASGAAMIWENSTDRYELFGGCGLSCSNTLWSFAGRPADWVPVATNGVLSARAGSTFAWDGADQVGILFGGSSGTGTNPTALGDGYFFSPNSSTWAGLGVSGGPGPRYDAPSAWADFPGCVGLIVVGGNTVLQEAPGNASVLEPVAVPQPNCFPDLISGGGKPPPPCSQLHTALSVFVYNNLTGEGIPNASVNVDGGCVHRTATTNAAGYLNLTIPAPDKLNVTGMSFGYRTNEVKSLFLPNTTNNIRLPLGPLPSLNVRTYGLNASGERYPLGGVTVDQGTSLVLGRTNPAGFLNLTQVDVVGGSLTVFGTLGGYSRASDTVHVPYFGPFWANVTLLDSGPLDLRVVDARTGAPAPGGSLQLSFLDPAGPPPITFATDPAGWFNQSAALAGNYSIVANVPGYLPNTTSFYHPWVATSVIDMLLTPKVGARLNVHLLDALTDFGIAGGQVTVAGFGTMDTSTSGWANFSDVRPAGLYEVTGSASAYSTNQSWVQLDYYAVVSPYDVHLQPVRLCPGLPGCPAPVKNATTPFGFLGGGGAVTAILYGAPLALLATGIAYVLLVLRPRTVARSTPRRPSPTATGSTR